MSATWSWLFLGLHPVQVIADLFFVLSFPVLWLRICKTGYDNISLETQILQLLVLSLRYLDLFDVFFAGDAPLYLSAYTIILKIYFILAAALTTALVARRCRRMRAWPLMLRLMLPCMLLALGIHYRFTPVELAWSFSQFLGAVAFVPQLRVLADAADVRDVDVGVGAYLALVCAWRALYLPNQFIRWLEIGQWDPVTVVCGVVQTGVFLRGGYVIVARTERRRNADVEQRVVRIHEEAERYVDRKLDAAPCSPVPVVEKPAVSLTDAAQYLDEVKGATSAETYGRFLDLMSAWQAKRLDKLGVIDGACALFADRPHLLRGLAAFLGPEYSMVLSLAMDEVMFVTPRGVVVRQLAGDAGAGT